MLYKLGKQISLEDELKNDKLNDYRIDKTKDGKIIFEGEYFKDHKIRGKLYLDDGYYIGEFKNNKYNGQGTIILFNGFTSKGEFKNGRLNGKGTITLSNGFKSEGTFINDVLNGQGKITSPDGYIYEGEFKNGKLNGQGKITSPDGSIDEGEFKEGVKILKSFE